MNFTGLGRIWAKSVGVALGLDFEADPRKENMQQCFRILEENIQIRLHRPIIIYFSIFSLKNKALKSLMFDSNQYFQGSPLQTKH